MIAVLPDSADNSIGIFGAREHNLKDISLSVPRDKFVVITGVSGSGKSTLAFDLLFAEGQRRFLDSMSTYARQYVEQMSKPDVDLITGLPPTVSIEQRNSRGGGKSTVATVTEIHHFLRLLFARLGTPFCPDCQLPVQPQTRDALVQQLAKEARERGPLQLLAPVVRNRKGFHTDIAEWALKHGHSHLRADGKLHDLRQPFRLDRFREHDVEVVVGGIKASRKGLIAEVGEGAGEGLIDLALEIGGRTLMALDAGGAITVHSTERACPGCGASFQLLDPKMFSYNSAQGWCPKCRGFGELFYLPDVERGARADAIEESWFEWQEGKREPCPECHGTRLNRIARAVRLRLEGVRETPTIVQFGEQSVGGALEFFQRLKVKGRDAEIARDILPEVRERLKFLCEVGLEYLQLSRSVTTLSGGEAQRIRLAAQLGSNLSGVLYVLDEPTIGLHSRDNDKLLHALSLLRARGNSLLVVEHDEETMRQADYIIDLGPGAGVNGGRVVSAGTLEQLMGDPGSVTGRELAARRIFPSRGSRRPVKLPRHGRKTGLTPVLHLKQARLHNLKNVSVMFPLGRFVAVTGVSGSGKSTLIRECLTPAVQARLSRDKTKRDGVPALLEGAEALKAIYEVDQTPIGRTPRSTPATYVGFLDDIRQLFAQTPTARMRGYGPGRFSFNSAQGRCPECEGAGVIKLEMNFMPSAYVTCETCGGCRYNLETLDILYRDKNIAQVLDLSVAEALEFFAPVPKIHRALAALRDTGLDYIKLGQVSPTLSGGEAQRIKLVTHLLTGLREQTQLLDPKSKRNLFVLEEPTIGLHGSDVRKLIEVLQRLVDAGHSVIVIEHHLDLIAEADWVIDLGPEGGEGGGEIVCEGTPEEVAACKRSHTGRYLGKLLGAQ